MKGYHKKKAIRKSGWLFSTMCSACAERDVPLGRDVCFASDVRFAREGAEHITSLCAQGAIHHYGEAITSLRQRRNITKKFPLDLSAILWYNENRKAVNS